MQQEEDILLLEFEPYDRYGEKYCNALPLRWYFPDEVLHFDYEIPVIAELLHTPNGIFTQFTKS